MDIKKLGLASTTIRSIALGLISLFYGYSVNAEPNNTVMLSSKTVVSRKHAVSWHLIEFTEKTTLNRGYYLRPTFSIGPLVMSPEKTILPYIDYNVAIGKKFNSILNNDYYFKEVGLIAEPSLGLVFPTFPYVNLSIIPYVKITPRISFTLPCSLSSTVSAVDKTVPLMLNMMNLGIGLHFDITDAISADITAFGMTGNHPFHDRHTKGINASLKYNL